jgi:hypothetical protein
MSQGRLSRGRAAFLIEQFKIAGAVSLIGMFGQPATVAAPDHGEVAGQVSKPSSTASPGVG